MADEVLSELLRRWRESGDPEDGARALRARLRAGDIGPERLRLAAWLGDEAARIALGDGAPAREPDLQEQLRRTELWGKAVSVRAALAAAERVLPIARESSTGEEAERALGAARAWLVCPCEEHARLAADAAAESLPDFWPDEDEPRLDVVFAVGAAGAAAQAAAEPDAPEQPAAVRAIDRASSVEHDVRLFEATADLPAGRDAWHAAANAANALSGGSIEADDVIREEALADVRRAVERALIAWALGARDDAL